MNIKRTVRRLIGKYNPKLLVSILYRIAYGKWMDWDNPRTLNEKIHWLKFNTDTSLWTLLADKYRVREYVKRCGCEELLVKLYGVWARPSEIDWDSLPEKFVMKSNCSSGDVRICIDKSSIDKDEWIAHFENVIKEKNGYERGEPHYNGIKPVIIAEELLDIDKQPIKTNSLIDYKVWCFNGVPNHVLVCSNRQKVSLELSVFDLNWNYHPECLNYNGHYVKPDSLLARPQSLHKMLKYAEILSRGIPQVRVDFYEIDGRPYFGELTFTSASGFMDYYTESYLLEMGDLIPLENK